MRCAITRQDVSTAPTVLNSWKEIAAYLQRGVRTVQRWERDLGLPVHRIGKGKRSPVYANVTELRFWLNTSDVAHQEYAHRAIPTSDAIREPRPILLERRNLEPLEKAQRLLSEAQHLAHKIAETSVRQRRQAEVLQARIQQMRARVR